MTVFRGIYFMVTIQQRSIYDGIVDGISKAKELGSPILISSTTKVKDIDPLLFYMAGNELFTGERFFWREPQHQILLWPLAYFKL
jgi:menaquinone-specific isochorismate synthase